MTNHIKLLIKLMKLKYFKTNPFMIKNSECDIELEHFIKDLFWNK